ncbi:hypothetical protein NXW04_04930 [Phocaeicola vulgatus]|nr:hypothetical protein [Phocaeicola vulgatus]
MVYTDLCSFYFSVFDEHAVDMTLEEFVKLLRGERWKVQVEEYQRLKASGRETEAKKLKRKLAALVIAWALRWEPCRNQSEAVERGRHAGCG